MEHQHRLEVHSVEIAGVRLGEVTGVAAGTLTVGVAEVSALVLADPRIAAVAVEVARPGEDVRIVHCLDSAEPRAKLGEGTVFPGFLGGMATVGSGATLRLAGVSVMASSRYPQPFSGLLQAREAVVDMAGPTARYSPFSGVQNVVLVFTPNPTVENDDYDDAIRRATLRVAEFLARSAIGSPAATTPFDTTTRHPGLPRVVYFYQLQGQGQMADTYLYGRDIHDLVPTLIHPGEVMDGAIVSGVYVYSCYKNPTYLHQNNPIIWELAARHGHDIDFVGIILNRGHNYTQDDKERSSRWAAKLAGMLEADGAILTAEGGGNSAIDMMLACQYLEQAGIKTVVVSSEAAGADGYSFPLFYSVPEADAIVSVGSEDEIVPMPLVGRVIGDEVLLDGTPASGPFDLKMYYHYCGTNQLGANVLVGRAF
jgi:glycine reductase